MKKLLLLLFLIPSLLFAQPQSHLSGQVVSIDATRAVNICSGTDDIRIATGCTGGGTQYTWVFDSATGGLSLGGGLLLPDGTSSTPAIAFSSYPDTGLYLSAADEIAITNNGTNTWRFRANGNLSNFGTGVLLLTNGTTGAPALSFNNDPDTGIYTDGTANELSISSGGAQAMGISSTIIDVNADIQNIDGTAASPSYTFASDPDSGMYQTGTANMIGFAVNGGGELTLDSATLSPVVAEGLAFGTASLPFGNINIGDNVYLQMYQAGSLRSFVGYDTTNGLVVDSDTSVRIYPNNTQAWQFATDGSLRSKVTSAGIVLVSPDASCSICTVNNSDVLSCASTSC